MSSIEVVDSIITGLDKISISDDYWEYFEPCPLCAEISTVKDVILVENGPILAVCNSCHFGFLSRRPNEQWINEFYDIQWDKAGPPQVVHPVSRAFDVCRKYFSDDPIRVLDVGAGYGGMLLPFIASGDSVMAIEASNQRSRFLESQKIEIASPSISKASSGICDLAIMHHSLEHVYDPQETISQVHRVLSDNGAVYIAVPDLWQEHPIQAAHYVPHLSLFTMEALLNLLKDEGFAPIYIQQGYDLEVMAVKNTHEWAVKIDYDFRATIEKWVNAVIGSLKGDATLIWSTQSLVNDRYPKWYAWGHADRPGEVLPVGHQGMLRVIWATIESNQDLPLSVMYNDGEPTVWVK